MSALRKYAVQKPKGKAWETIALVEDAQAGRQEFQAAVEQYGKGYVRLIQVDFTSPDALSDYDWSLLDLHDPFKGERRFKPTVIAGSERASSRVKKPVRPGNPQSRPGAKSGSHRRADPSGPQAPVPMASYISVLLFAALVLVLWALWFRV